MAWFRRRRSEREEEATPATVIDPVAEARAIAATLCEELGWPPAWVLEQDARCALAGPGPALGGTGRDRRRAGRNGGGAQLAGLLALRLHVPASAVAGLESNAADELFLRVRRAAGAGGSSAAACCDRIAAMYVTWAERRGMQVERLRAGAAAGAHVLLVGGLGAGVLLEPERGLHVFEGDDDTPRVTVAVDVAALPPAKATERDLAAVADELLTAAGVGDRVVRRYRERDAPLVRDAGRGYRTGRLDRVLAGDFDLF